MTTLRIKVRDFFLLDVYSVDLDSQNLGERFEVQLYRNGAMVESSAFEVKSNGTLPSFRMRGYGVYQAKLVSTGSNGEVIASSNVVRFDGFPGQGNRLNQLLKPVVIVGVTPFAASVKTILESHYDVIGFETTNANRHCRDFFGVPVRGIMQFGTDVKRVVVDEASQTLVLLLDRSGAEYEIVTNSPRVANILTRSIDTLPIVAAQRFSHRLHDQLMLDEGAKLVQDRLFFTFNCYLPFTVDMPESTKLGYGGIGVVLHARTRLGEGVSIGQNVTLGGRHGRVADIGDGAWIGPGAMVLGASVGAGAIVGANAVVVKDVPPGARIVGPEGRQLGS